MADVKDKVEELYKQHKFQELYEYLQSYKDSTDPEILWRLVRATRDRACMAGVSNNEKKKMIFEGYEVSKRALELGDNISACHKWYGIMLSEKDDFIGTKQKIEDSPTLKKHFERAIELDGSDPIPHYLMGMWCFKFADLAWYERKIAAVVFGNPPNATYQEALDHFQKAEGLSPSSFSSVQLMLGTAHLKLGNKEEAKKWFTKLQDFDAIKEEDKENLKKAKDHLKKL